MNKNIVHYVYALYYQGIPVYIGISYSPVERLIIHKRSVGGNRVGVFMGKVKNLSDLHISILDKIKTSSLRKCKDCHNIEQKWIHKFLSEGHKLINILVTKNNPNH